ncbi:MAG: YARHG domain-containing protein [Hyphomicrobiales bacterium]
MMSLKVRHIQKIVTVCFGIVLLQLSLLLTPAFAEDACDDLWYSRNFYFDQAGYCFGSKLGKAVFDNSNCKSKNVALTKSTKRRISQMKEIEKEFDCEINTEKARPLNIPQLKSRELLVEQPISQGLESGCYGYTGVKQIPLYSARSKNSKIIGYIENGDDIDSSHDEVDNSDWWFAGVSTKSGKSSVGWTKASVFDQCKVMAG